MELVVGEPSATHVLPAQPKRLALLAYLVLAKPRGPHKRDLLLPLFWPDLNAEEGRRALRQALHALRRHLGADVLQSTRDDQVTVVGDGSWCDAVAFEQAMVDGRPLDAMALYHGAFLDGVFVSDASAEFEQWVELVRGQLRSRAATALDALAAEARFSGDHAAEVRWAAEASQLAPDDEPRIRVLMQALRNSGDRASALRTYERFAEHLSEEFDAEPAKETEALANTIRLAPPVPDVPLHVEEAALESRPEPSASPRVSAPAVAPRPKVRRRWLALAASALVMTLAVWRFAAGSRATNGGADGILVADFRNHTRDSLLAGAITEALRADLSQSRKTRVMSRAQVQAVLKRMQQPVGSILSDALVREVAERDGVKAFVSGDISSLGNGFTVSAELISVKGGEILVSVREDAADSTKLLGAVDRVSDQLRRGIGESLWAVRASLPLEQVTTSSLQALRLYSQAIRVGEKEGDNRRSIAILRQAVALDTSFAMAYRRLGVYLRDYGERAAADDALSRAFRNRDRLPELERYHAAGSYYLNVSLPDSAIATYRALLALYPTDTRGLNNLATVYMDLKDFARAEALYHRALESDSSIALIYNSLATDQLNGGRYDASAQTLVVRARKFPVSQEVEAITASISLARGDIDATQQRAEAMLAAAGSEGDGRTEPLKMLGTLGMIRGRLDDAERYERSVTDLQDRHDQSTFSLTAAIVLGFIDIWYRQMPERGLAVIDSTLRRHPLDSIAPLDRNYGFLAYAYALGGRPARARALLADLMTAEHVSGATPGGLGLRDEGSYLRALGTTEIAEGRFAQAVVTLRRAVALSTCPNCALADLARAYELAGKPDSAIAMFERYVVTPWSEWQNAEGEFRVPAYEHLGRLYEARGDSAHAIAAYDRVSTLWRGADAELQPQVADARHHAALLRRR
ncbi:MAG: BTAD domain-containing putative transcriptional regulator [Gemmatimonadaceae bacterium]